MKENLTKSWTNNLGMKLFSLPLAFVIWIIIINIDDPTVSRNFLNVPVELLNSDALDTLGKVYEIAEGKSVTVTVTGRRSIVDKVRSNDLKVTADLKQMSAFNKIDLEVNCEKYSYTDLSCVTRPKMMTVSLEDKITKQFKINVETIGAVDENCYVGTLEANPKMIEISGAQSVVERIADVRVVVTLNEETSDFRHSKLVPKVYDANGKEIDSSGLEFSDTSINVKVGVQNTKIVPITVTTTGTPLVGYAVAEMNYDPSQIRVTGSDAALRKITSIPIEVDVTNARSTIEKEIVLTPYLPEGVSIVGNTNSIAVKVTIQQMASKKIAFTADNIATINIPEGLEYSFTASEHIYEVNVMGMESELESLSPEQLGAYIDLTGLSEGVHMVAIQFEAEEGFIITGNLTISVDLFTERGNIEDNSPTTPEITDEEQTEDVFQEDVLQEDELQEDVTQEDVTEDEAVSEEEETE